MEDENIIDDIYDDIDCGLTIDDVICDLELEIEKFEEYVDKLWNVVILPHANDFVNHSTLNKLTEFHKSKFHKYMLDNSPAVGKINSKLLELKKIRDS